MSPGSGGTLTGVAGQRRTVMTKQRDRMKQDLEFRGYAVGTRAQYLMAVKRFAEHFARQTGFRIVEAGQ